MNDNVKNGLKVLCVMLGAGLSMVGQIMGNNDKKEPESKKDK